MWESTFGYIFLRVRVRAFLYIIYMASGKRGSAVGRGVEAVVAAADCGGADVNSVCRTDVFEKKAGRNVDFFA